MSFLDSLLGARSRRFMARYAIGLFCLLGAGCSAMGRGGGAMVESRLGASGADSSQRRIASTDAPVLTAVPNVDYVILLTVDAFRADQPWVGYGGVETPNLSKLAARSLVYTRSYSLANLTTASLNAMLASRYASELGREGCIFGKYDLDGSLAPYLQSRSVMTFGAHGHSLFAGRVAPSLGFERWMLVKGAATRLQGDGAVVGGEIADLINHHLAESRSKHRKIFVWGHFPDPHDSYAKHASFPPKGRSTRARYDSEVAYTDAVIGNVLDAIDRNGLRDRAAIILTGDHGEAFGEHGTLRHGFTMFEEEVRVPLLVHLPGVEHRTVDAIRSTIDIAPTIVELFGHSPPPVWRGKSLLRDVTDPTPEKRPVIVDFPEMKGRDKIQAVIMDGIKVIMTPGGATVFDLAEDPQERNPISKSSDRARAAIAAARRYLEALDFKRPSPCAG